MATQIFVNLPIKNLDKTVEFFTKLGFTFNPQFTDEKATCMVVSENIFFMLLVEEFFKTFTKKEISDSTKTTEAILTISTESREKVDDMINKALEAGGSLTGEAQDHGWMYVRGFYDLDGHHWEIMFADMSQMPQQ